MRIQNPLRFLRAIISVSQLSATTSWEREAPLYGNYISIYSYIVFFSVRCFPTPKVAQICTTLQPPIRKCGQDHGIIGKITLTLTYNDNFLRGDLLLPQEPRYQIWAKSIEECNQDLGNSSFRGQRRRIIIFFARMVSSN